MLATRKTYGILAIANRHPRLFSALMRQALPLYTRSLHHASQ